jgi:hypothetical protein
MIYEKTIPARHGAFSQDGGKRFMIRTLVIDDDANVGAAIQAILVRQECETIVISRAHAGIHAPEE